MQRVGQITLFKNRFSIFAFLLEYKQHSTPFALGQLAFICSLCSRQFFSQATA